MQWVSLTPKECQELMSVVQERAGELSNEIHHASVSTFRDHLRERKTLLMLILEKLREVDAAS